MYENLSKILEKIVLSRPGLNKERIMAAFAYMEKICGDAIRNSGDKVIDHISAVLDILLPMHPDEDTIIVSILHDVPKHSKYVKDDVEREFGKEVLDMIEAVNMLKRIKSSDQSAELESFRKMFFALAKDVRVVLIKIIDRLHNLKMSLTAPAEVKKLMAKETMDIYVPVTARLGIYGLKTSLEDLAFSFLYPQQYEYLKGQLDDYIARADKNIDEIKKDIEDLLSENNIEAKIEGRIKGLYSIYRKLKVKNQSTLNDLFDVFAVRIVLPDKLNLRGQPANDHLYSILGLIHGKWTPLTNRFKDYIAVPKPNGYQSLHTAVMGIGNRGLQAVEIQIRTLAMHEKAEFGIASHWLYEDTKKSSKHFMKADKSDLVNVLQTVEQYGDWVNELDKLQSELKSGHEVMHALKFDLFNDRIFVFTPVGDLKDLPQGATPIDFAYSVHSEIGDHAQVAKVNGMVVPLNYELQNGEVVEIVANKRSEPKSQWLSFVKTSLAKARIRSYLKSSVVEEKMRRGKEKSEKESRDPFDDDLDLSDENKISNAKLIDLIPVRISKRILPRKKIRKIYGGSKIVIAGEVGIPYRFANCCRPKVGQPVWGHLTLGKVVSIHVEGCKFLKDVLTGRLVKANWGSEVNQRKLFPVKLVLMAKNRVGLIRDVAEVISNMNIDIADFGRSKHDPSAADMTAASREIVLNVADDEQFDELLEKLRRVVSVLNVLKAD